MAVLNLRKVPEDLMRQLRKAAIDAGEPFHTYCVHMLSSGLRGRGVGYGDHRSLIVDFDEAHTIPDKTGRETLAVRPDACIELPPAPAPAPRRGSAAPTPVKVDIT